MKNQHLFPYLCVLALILTMGTAAVHAKEADSAPFAATLETAWQDLEQLENLLDDPDALNRDITAYMDVVVRAASKLRLPALPDGEEVASDVKRDRSKWERSIAKYRDETVDLLLEALSEDEIGRSGKNIREPVNKHAGPLLAKTPAFLTDSDDRKRLSRRIIRKIKRLERARHDVHADVFEGAFLALARLGEMRSLEWLMDNYLHARKQPEEVARLRAALRSMREFSAISPRLRHDLVDEMLKRYVAMESLAEQSTTDVTALAAKRFWDQVRTDAIPLIQYAAGFPRTEAGVALAKMSEFADWFREHDNARDPVWSRAPVKAAG